MRRKVLNILTAALCVISCGLLIAALVITYWFGTAQTITTTDSVDPSVTYQAVYDVKLSPFKVRWLVTLYGYRLGVQIQNSKEVDYDGALNNICSIKQIRDQINSQSICDRIQQGGTAVGAVGIVACGLCGVTAFICLIAYFTDNCRNKCCVCLITLLMDITFLAVLIVAALWGALAIYGKDQINDQVPKFTNSFLPSTAVQVTTKGTFAAQIALWLSVAAIGPVFIAMIVNWMACCCATNDSDTKDRSAAGATVRAPAPMIQQPQQAPYRSDVEAGQRPAVPPAYSASAQYVSAPAYMQPYGSNPSAPPPRASGMTSGYAPTSDNDAKVRM